MRGFVTCVTAAGFPGGLSARFGVLYLAEGFLYRIGGPERTQRAGRLFCGVPRGYGMQTFDAFSWNLILATAGIAVTHTLFGPDHYLPFIMLAQARRWSRWRTVLVTACCVRSSSRSPSPCRR